MRLRPRLTISCIGWCPTGHGFGSGVRAVRGPSLQVGKNPGTILRQAALDGNAQILFFDFFGRQGILTDWHLMRSKNFGAKGIFC